MRQTIKQRLEAIRQNLREESASYQDFADLAELADFIPLDDVELREPSGRPEFVDAPHVVRTFRVTLQSDKGRHRATTSAQDADTAREIVCKAQGAPLCAVIKTEETTKQPRPYLVRYRYELGYNPNGEYVKQYRGYIVNACTQNDAVNIVYAYCGVWFGNYLRGWRRSVNKYNGAKITRNMTDLRTIQEGAK